MIFIERKTDKFEKIYLKNNSYSREMVTHKITSIINMTVSASFVYIGY